MSQRQTRSGSDTAPDPVLSLRGLGKGIWTGENPDDYVRRLREHWGDETTAQEQKMQLDELARKFLEVNHTAIMVTVRANGTAHVARVSCGLVDGKLWSSGTKNRVRTKHLRMNPRATLCIFARDRRWIGVEATITIHEDPDVPHKALALQRAQGREPEDVDAFLEEMAAQERIIYEFVPERVYGSFEEAPHA